MSKYLLPAATLVVPPGLARELALLIEPGRRSFEARVTGHTELRQWLLALDTIASSSPLPRVETIWCSTVEAARLLDLSPRQVRNLKGKIRSRRAGRALEFDLADVQAEADARQISPASPMGNPSESTAA